jgi:hypothetical protein
MKAPPRIGPALVPVIMALAQWFDKKYITLARFLATLERVEGTS